VNSNRLNRLSHAGPPDARKSTHVHPEKREKTMVLRLNGQTMPYLKPQVAIKPPEKPAAEEPPCPLLEVAQKILRRRLTVTADALLLDGIPSSLLHIIGAVNKQLKAVGGPLLSYPGLNPLYGPDAAMRLNQPAF
jgi:hypothetical protein